MRTALTAVALLLAAVPSVASAATVQVTTTGDPSPGACSPGSCSLREAVLAADANGPGPDAVKVPKGTYYLTRGELLATSTLTLRGAGARRTTINPSRSPGESRALHIRSSPPATVTVSGLEITGADLKAGDGGGIFLEGDSTLNLVNVAIYANEAFNGAGVRADGTLNVLGSTFFANHALGVDKGKGPAIAFMGGGRGLIVNSTFVANHGPNRGGAIDFSPSLAGTLSLVNANGGGQPRGQAGRRHRRRRP